MVGAASWCGGLSTTEDHLSAVTCQDEILQPVTIPHLHNLGHKPILQDDNAHPHRSRVITHYLQDLTQSFVDSRFNSNNKVATEVIKRLHFLMSLYIYTYTCISVFHSLCHNLEI